LIVLEHGGNPRANAFPAAWEKFRPAAQSLHSVQHAKLQWRFCARTQKKLHFLPADIASQKADVVSCA
jgi:hypothetical protein